MLEVQRVHARLETLGEFNYRMSEEDIRLTWTTMDYPAVSPLCDFGLVNSDSLVIIAAHAGAKYRVAVSVRYSEYGIRCHSHPSN